jgi:hypothetical protein
LTFLVWNPARGLPTRSHNTLESAAAEAFRLWNANPGQRFYVMAPVMAEGEARDAKAFSAGKAEGLDEAHRQIVDADARADRYSNLYDELMREVQAYRRCDDFLSKAREYQAIVADALLWFDGFAAAHAHQDIWERPSIPDRSQLRDLNGKLQDLARAAISAKLDEEIPF